MDSKSNITQEQKEAHLDVIVKTFTSIGSDASYSAQIKQALKACDYIGSIYEDGFNKGFEEGKKLGINMFKNN